MKAQIKEILLAILVISPIWANSQTKGHFGLPGNDVPREYVQQGDLVSIKIIPGNKETKIFVVGNEIAQFKFDQMEITGLIKLGKNEKKVSFFRKKDHFTTKDALSGKLELRLKLLEKEKVENFNFQLRPTE